MNFPVHCDPPISPLSPLLTYVLWGVGPAREDGQSTRITPLLTASPSIYQMLEGHQVGVGPLAYLPCPYCNFVWLEPGQSC